MKNQNATNMVHVVPCTITKFNSHAARAFADVCQLHQLRRPGDVVLN